MRSLLKQYFGFDGFREGQEQAINSIISGRSAAAIFPTGAGKSLVYQLSALALPELTLVVSPLLSLIQDQLSFLKSKGIPSASLDSTLSKQEYADVLNMISKKEIKILFISVERLNNERFRNFIKKISVSLLCVDEAHCLSQWGHNFRPSYLALSKYQVELGIPQALLLTATATPDVVKDMCQQFSIAEADVSRTGFYRQNLNLGIEGVSNACKFGRLTEWLSDKSHQSGIVYVTLQKTADTVAKQLLSAGIDAQAYHAGMNTELRQQIQKKFMSSESGVVVATVAFGMGIDKSRLNFVCHYDLPSSIEAYSQEVGRAGRDGSPSECLVLANTENLNIIENFVYGDTPELPDIKVVLQEIKQQGLQWDVVLNSLSTNSNIKALTLKTLLVYLELEGIIQPKQSYYADYKYKFLWDKNAVINFFNGERQSFVSSIFNASKIAKVWGSLNFEQMYVDSGIDRSRAITALDYMEQQGMIELQVKQMTEVYQVVTQNFSVENLSGQLFSRFKAKEVSDIARIHSLLTFFSGGKCISTELSHYFGDFSVEPFCGHCSVCLGNIAVLPDKISLKSIDQFSFVEESKDIIRILGDKATPVLVTRFFCGLVSPILTKLRVRGERGFNMLEEYRFSDVKSWVERGIKCR
tara:strand:- start:3610 stop:5529 length:1920 start_codon:yes stop_codon:yes gene_type:complete